MVVAVVEVVIVVVAVYFDAAGVETSLSNPDISERLRDLGISKRTEIIADSAESKSIEELKRLGWYMTSVKKGADSVKNSIDILKRYRFNITRNSINLQEELSRYKWRTDHLGKTTNEPVDRFIHLIDPLRYIALNKLKISKLAMPKANFLIRGLTRRRRSQI